MIPLRARQAEWFTDPWELYRALEGAGGRALLESARAGGATGRWSILAEKPFLTFQFRDGRVHLSGPVTGNKSFHTEDPLGVLQKLVRAYAVEPAGPMPAFGAGAIGYLSYECKDTLLPRTASRLREELPLPEMTFFFFDRSIVWDHIERRLWFCHAPIPGLGEPAPERWERDCRRFLERRLSRETLFIQEPVQKPADIRCSMSPEEYTQAVRAVQREIRSGEIFQANLAHRFDFELPQGAREAYARLRELNPSPFFGILEGDGFEIVSGSPERLLKLEGRSLQTRPIAGTRRRGADRREDERLAEELLLSEKERAEHVMLVDLERNDLGRVCEYGSVDVDEFLALEEYSHVRHIVSNVRGTLREGLDAFDALRAFFPGGTITGAPKIRSMQVIDSLETVGRGPYTGSLGYFSFAGGMDFNILIRSLIVKDGYATLHAGAGIVADSDPEKEYHETLHKAEAVLQAVFGPENVREFFRGVAARVS